MKKFFLMVILVLILINIQAFGVKTISNANSETILYVSPLTTVQVGEIFSVNISIQDVIDLYAFHLFLGYNTTVLDVLSVYVYPPFNSGQILPPIIDETNGYVEVSGNLGVPGPSVSGSFPIVKITFNATAIGKSVLDLYNTDLRDSMSNSIAHLTVDGEVLIYPHVTHTDFALEVTQVQCDVSRESGVIYFKLPTWSLFGPNTVVYDNLRQAVWMTSVNITYGDWGAVETFNGVMVMFNITDGSALLYKFPLDVGWGFKGLGPSSCTLDDDGNVWIAIDMCFWVPEELPESIPSLAKLCPEANILTVFWLPKEFGWVSYVKFHDGSVWCQSEKYLIKMPSGDAADFWKISDNPSSGRMYVDGNYIWITLYDANEAKRFNILTDGFDADFTNINKPLDICGTSSHIFMVESGGDSIIAINKENLVYSRIQVDKMPSYLCGTVKGNVWWSSPNSSIGVMGKIYNNTYSVKCKSSGPLTEGSNNIIWFSGRNYQYYLGPPFVTCNLYICMRSDIRSPDVNKDGIVNARDVTYLVLLFRATPTSPKWDQDADIDGDDIIDARDITIAILNFGKKA
jgi:hypothetical protein